MRFCIMLGDSTIMDFVMPSRAVYLISSAVSSSASTDKCRTFCEIVDYRTG